MTRADELILSLSPLLTSDNIEDLLKGRDALIRGKEGMSKADRERIGDECSTVMQSIEAAMGISRTKIPQADDDGIPTLDANTGTWSNQPE